jgi:hypothetical protein
MVDICVGTAANIHLDTIAGQGTKKCSLGRQWKMMSSGNDAGDAGPGEI